MEDKELDNAALHRNEVTCETEKIGKYYKWMNKIANSDLPIHIKEKPVSNSPDK